MPGGAYIALSGLRFRSQQIDQLAADIANAATSGYKAERSGAVASPRPSFQAALDAAIDVRPGAATTDFRPGTLVPTGRDLDFAIDGDGFFVVQTPAGPRYTRNGQFTRSASGTLTTMEGYPVLGKDGEIRLGDDPIEVEADGTVKAGKTPVGKLSIVDFTDRSLLEREEGSRFRAPASTRPAEVSPIVRGGSLEQSNVSIVERLAQLTEVSRNFEALNRGISVLMNDLDARAINELGRR